MKTRRAQYVFGPVPSRRLGRSLGVDLVPLKTCSYDCIYCQLGRTTCKTVERRDWVSIDVVLEELKGQLSWCPDHITLGGSGEPTLHARLGELIEGIRALTDIPVAVLTNGSLLWREDVRVEVTRADVVLPSLDAADPERFAFINRPHAEITFERLIEGLTWLRREHAGAYWLEVMLLAGYTALPAEVQRLAEWTRRIRPDRVQLNTAVRPPAEEYALAVPSKRLKDLARMFEPAAEVIAERRVRGGRRGTRVLGGVLGEGVLALLRRRPCSAEDVAIGLGLQLNEALKLLESLEGKGAVRWERREGRVFYCAAMGSVCERAGWKGSP